MHSIIPRSFSFIRVCTYLAHLAHLGKCMDVSTIVQQSFHNLSLTLLTGNMQWVEPKLQEEKETKLLVPITNLL